VLNIGRLGTDVGALVNYYIGDADHEKEIPHNAGSSSATEYYVGGHSGGRWVGALRHGLGVEGHVEEDAFRRLIQGCHPLTGVPLTPGALDFVRRRETVRSTQARRRNGGTLNVAQAARRLDLPERRVRKLLERGTAMGDHAEGAYLRGAKEERNAHGPGRGTWRLPEAEVHRFQYDQAKAELRPGFDLTLRPPKSVSILWALGEADWSQRIAEAHREAVDEVVAYYEASAIYSRKRVDGEQVRITTGGLIGAAFDHQTSRAGDPLLHTHVVTFNVTRCTDDNWRSLDGTPIYENAKSGGYLYQAHLRHTLSRTLGVKWTAVENGCAEIEGIPRSVIDVFSKRRDEIECAVAEAGYSSAAAHQAATLETRSPKVGEPEPPVALARWWNEARESGLSEERLATVVGVQVAKPPSVSEPEVDALFQELAGPNGLTEMASTFTQREIIQAVAEHAGDRCTAAEVLALAQRFVAEVQPVDVRVVGRDGDVVLDGDELVRNKALSRYSTKELISKERQLGEWAQRAVSQSGSFAKRPVVEHLLQANESLTDEQMHMVMTIALGGSRLHLVAGNPGSGKTYAAKVAVDALVRSGVPVVGAALSADAGAELEDSLDLSALTGRPSSTVSALQVELDHPQFGGFQHGTVLILDEASMMGTRALARLVDHLDAAHGSLVLIGDPNQHGSVAAGGVYQHLVSKYPDRVIALRENNRQVDDVERRAIAEFRDGKVKEALGRYAGAGRVIVSKSAGESYDRMVADWFMDWEAGDRSPMLAGPNAMREALNGRARSALLAVGKLGAESIIVADREFRPGDFVVAKRNKRDLRGTTGASVKNGSVGTVTAVDEVAGTVSVQFDREGDLTVPNWYLVAGELDHAYARTTYGVQGKTTTKTAYQPTDVSSFEEGYVALTRAKTETRIYVMEADEPEEATARCCDYNDRGSSEDLVIRALEQRKAKLMAHDVGVPTV
jgi:conjugative relaxase-like TrwC/TraI family protein